MPPLSSLEDDDGFGDFDDEWSTTIERTTFTSYEDWGHLYDQVVIRLVSAMCAGDGKLPLTNVCVVQDQQSHRLQPFVRRTRSLFVWPILSAKTNASQTSITPAMWRIFAGKLFGCREVSEGFTCIIKDFCVSSFSCVLVYGVGW